MLPGMITTRRAVPEDAPAIVELRHLMFTAMGSKEDPRPWRQDAEELLRKQLADPESGFLVHVVDGDNSEGAVACAVGTVEQRLPAPGHPTGKFGFIFNVCTQPAYFRRGYAKKLMTVLLADMAAHGVSRVDLHASAESGALYEDLGFAEHSRALSLDLRTRPPAV
jgi:ribosomal protein S18 acetylase RimI-like enzyme